MADSAGCSCAQVKVDATMALRNFIEEYEEEDIGALKPLIPQLLNEIFKLMSEVGHATLASTSSTRRGPTDVVLPVHQTMLLELDCMASLTKQSMASRWFIWTSNVLAASIPLHDEVDVPNVPLCPCTANSPEPACLLSLAEPVTLYSMLGSVYP